MPWLLQTALNPAFYHCTRVNTEARRAHSLQTVHHTAAESHRARGRGCSCDGSELAGLPRAVRHARDLLGLDRSLLQMDRHAAAVDGRAPRGAAALYARADRRLRAQGVAADRRPADAARSARQSRGREQPGEPVSLYALGREL